MNLSLRFAVRVLGATTLLVFLHANLVAGDEPKSSAATTADKPAATKWRSLFDGKTLENWEKTDFGGQGAVEVKDGRIVMGMGQPLTGITWKGKDLPLINYELQLEAQRVEGNDFFCALTFPVGKDPCTLVLGGWGGGVIGLSNIDGFDASENETTGYKTFEDGKWYKVRVRAQEDRIQAWLDDARIVNVETKDKRIGVRIEVEANRPLGVCTYQTVGALRKIEVRELSKEELAQPAK
jgi:hypothetical protein